MAQLRDIHTSECVFEGTPTECVLLAEKLGRDEVLFDDVGLGFDPDAVLSAYKDSVKSDSALAKSKASDVTSDDRAAAQARVESMRAVESDADKAQDDAEQALAAARARLEG